MKISLIIISLLIVCSTVNAQQLWQNTRIGMTVAEVKALYPHALDINTNVPIKGYEESYPGHLKCLLVIEKYEMINHLFDVMFIFSEEENKLIDVQLHCNAESVWRYGHSIYYRLYDEFIFEYGKPIVDERTRATREESGRWYTEWQSIKTKIILYYWHQSEQSNSILMLCSLSVHYYTE